MAYTHSPLDEDTLGPGVLKVVGENAPPPMRGMVAKGLAPLPPRDLVVALYHLWVTNDPNHAEEAGKTVAGLPEPVLGGALQDPQLPQGALDFLGRKLLKNADLLDRVVRHPNVHDETLAGLARVCPENVCDTLAENQQRWLAFPKIVEQLYQNPKCRMSVVHRMLELAMREGVELHLPAMDEIKAAMAEEGGAPDEERDGLFQSMADTAVAGHDQEVAAMEGAAATDEVDLDAVRQESAAADQGELDLDALLDAEEDMNLPMEGEDAEEAEEKPEAEEEEEEQDGRARRIDAAAYSKLRPMEKIRLALMGETFERQLAIRDSNRAVALSAIKSPRVKENEVVAYAANRTLSHDVIRYIARRREWVKLYTVKLNLVMNPKTPMSIAMTFVSHLRRGDVRKVAQSKNIPSALATAAKRRMGKRR